MSRLNEPNHIYAGISAENEGVHVSVKQGDITEEKVDAIVNSANPEFDFTQGWSLCFVLSLFILDYSRQLQ